MHLGDLHALVNAPIAAAHSVSVVLPQHVCSSHNCESLIPATLSFLCALRVWPIESQTPLALTVWLWTECRSEQVNEMLSSLKLAEKDTIRFPAFMKWITYSESHVI